MCGRRAPCAHHPCEDTWRRVRQVVGDPGKFAGDDVITEQTTQTFSAVLGTTETMSDATVDAISEALNEVRGQ